MKILEKHLPEAKRLLFFKFIYGLLFAVLFIFLINRQVFQADAYHEKERKQGQRRIIRPGPRGDVVDREGRLLIGNRAHFSAVLHLELLSSEIWNQKRKLRALAFKMREELEEIPVLSLKNLLARCYLENFICSRGVKIYGRVMESNETRLRPKIYFQEIRQNVVEQKDGSWSCSLNSFDESKAISFKFENTSEEINVDVAGLFKITFPIDSHDLPVPYYQKTAIQTDWLDSILGVSNEKFKKANFFTSGFSLDWESRFLVVKKYLDEVNFLTGRNDEISFEELKNHWKRRLVLPLEISGNLLPAEYASLIEGLHPGSPVQIQAEAVRHYPFRSFASHVLGYVGSGYESNPQGLSGEDLATFEIKGRSGKAGIEKKFDLHLRGKDGGDIWRVNPMGSRYEQVEKQSSEKGKKIKLSLDLDIQKIAESSLGTMSKRVSSHRILPDLDWKKTIERRTRKGLVDSNEIDLSPELLLTAFKDAPFPLGGEEASTVAGFGGTEEDAKKLLRILYTKGVLEKDNSAEDKYSLAPPPPPPGAAVLVDVNTGEILVLASKPDYNLQNLSPRISQSAYDDIERREAWLPRAWHPGYCPASPFKLVTAVAALRAKVVTPDEKFICDGIYKGMICHCYPGKHGEMDLRNAEAQSCNVYFYQLAELLGEDPLISEAKSFGMDQTPDLELPRLRNSPNVPDPEWKKKRVRENWALEDTFNVAIGQGGLRQSPLQMACFAAALAKRQKRIEPTLIYSNQVAPPSESIGLTNEEFTAIIEGMHLATIRGTAKRCKVEGVEIAGKTGTAQWRNHNMKLSLAWFIGFAPVEKPEVAIAVLIEGVIPQDNIQGGLTATPVARDILQAYFDKKSR